MDCKKLTIINFLLNKGIFVRNYKEVDFVQIYNGLSEDIKAELDALYPNFTDGDTALDNLAFDIICQNAVARV